MSNNRELADLISQAGGTSEGVLAGRRNLILNGGFDVWQRGTSFSAGGYTADRWAAPNPGTLSVTKLYDSTLGLNYLTNTNSGGWGIYTRLEAKDVQHLRAGTVVTFSLYTTVASGDKLRYKANTGTKLEAGLTTIETIGSWYRKSVTITVTSEMETLFDFDQYLNILYEPFVAANTPYSVTGVQLELGSVATPFEHRSYGEELALCQRYYQKSYDINTVPATVTNTGIHYWCSNGNNNSIATSTSVLQVMMRAAPTVTLYSPVTGTSAKMWCDDTSADEGGQTYTASARCFTFRTTAGSTTDARYKVHYTADAEL